MLKETSLEASTDSEALATEYAERCTHWIAAQSQSVPRRKRRERRAEPLVLTGHGLSIRVEKGTLSIRDGLTHFPQEKATYRFFKGALDTPQRIVLVDGSGEITLDALDWMAAQGVALIRLTWDGEALSIMSPTGYAADPERVDWQRATRADPAARLAFNLQLVRAKLAASIETLSEQLPASKARDAALTTAEAVRASLVSNPPASPRELLGREGKAALAYWRAWQGLGLRWKGDRQRPIPDDWRRFTSRQSLATGVLGKNRNASHPINAMLNYAYAVLEARLKVQTVADGFDPTLGIVHSSYKGSPAYVLDLMEPERPKIDAVVLRLAQESTFSGGDFTLRKDGVCQINPLLARVVSLCASATLDEKFGIKAKKTKKNIPICKRKNDQG